MTPLLGAHTHTRRAQTSRELHRITERGDEQTQPLIVTAARANGDGQGTDKSPVPSGHCCPR